MKKVISLSAAMLLPFALALPAGNAAAQGKNLVGAWTIVSSDNVDAAGKKTPIFGSDLRGSLIFTANGRYSLTLARAKLPKFASDNRNKGTAEENQAVVGGSLSHFGKYSTDDKDKSFTFLIETSTYPNWDGTTQKRSFTIKGDQLSYTTPAASGGGRADLVWKRVK